MPDDEPPRWYLIAMTVIWSLMAAIVTVEVWYVWRNL